MRVPWKATLLAASAAACQSPVEPTTEPMTVTLEASVVELMLLEDGRYACEWTMEGSAFGGIGGTVASFREGLVEITASDGTRLDIQLGGTSLMSLWNSPSGPSWKAPWLLPGRGPQQAWGLSPWPALNPNLLGTFILWDRPFDARVTFIVQELELTDDGVSVQTRLVGRAWYEVVDLPCSEYLQG